MEKDTWFGADFDRQIEYIYEKEVILLSMWMKLLDFITTQNHKDQIFDQDVVREADLLRSSLANMGCYVKTNSLTHMYGAQSYLNPLLLLAIYYALILKG
jgi:hypothetical protein